MNHNLYHYVVIGKKMINYLNSIGQISYLMQEIYTFKNLILYQHLVHQIYLKYNRILKIILHNNKINNNLSY